MTDFNENSFNVINIREFHPELIRPNSETYDSPKKGFRLVMIGKPNSGKSNLIKALLFWKKHYISVAMVMSGSEDANHDFEKFIHPLFIYNKYEPERVEQFIKRQKLAIEHLDNPWSALVIDDCTDKPSDIKSELQHGIFKRGRHWQMFYLLSLQYCMDIDPSIRTCVDGVFIFREPNIKTRRKLWENYASIIPEFNLFCQIMDEITTEHTALYIHNSTTSNDWHDCVYYYKAPNMYEEYPDFKFGCEDYWKFGEARYNKDFKEHF